MATRSPPAKSRPRPSARLPAFVRSLFWDCDRRTVCWREHKDFVIGRVLGSGTWEAVQWLRKQLGDSAVREWLLCRRGRGLSPRQVRFWELVLDLPRREVDAWLRDEARQVWDQRIRR